MSTPHLQNHNCRPSIKSEVILNTGFTHIRLFAKNKKCPASDNVIKISGVSAPLS